MGFDPERRISTQDRTSETHWNRLIRSAFREHGPGRKSCILGQDPLWDKEPFLPPSSDAVLLDELDRTIEVVSVLV